MADGDQGDRPMERWRRLVGGGDEGRQERANTAREVGGLLRRWAARPGEAGGRNQHMADLLWADQDGAAAARATLEHHGDGLHIAMDNSGWVITEPQLNLLVVGPARTAHKSSAVMIPLVLTATGPVVSTSIKADVLRATALTRARYGRLWHYAPDGITPTPEGVTPLYWSPIQGAERWDTAYETADAMVGAAGVGAGIIDSSHWKQRAGDLLGPLLFYAAHTGRDMNWVYDVAHEMPLVRPLLEAPDGGPGDLVRMAERSRGAHLALGKLKGIMLTSDRERASIFSATQVALKAYSFEASLDSTQEPNFDPAQFVSGSVTEAEAAAWRSLPARGFGNAEAAERQIIRGRCDTLYITTDTRRQELMQPLVVGLLAQLRAATYDQHRQDEQFGVRGRAPVTYALDELANIAPIQDLPQMLSQCGSQGLVVAAALQDYSQARKRWGDEAKGLGSHFHHKLFFRGIEDPDTLEWVSKLVGDWDRPMTSNNQSYTTGGWTVPSSSTSGSTYSTQREAILPPSAIRQGNPDNPDHTLYLYNTPRRGAGWGWVHTTPYYRTSPWPAVLVSTMEWWTKRLPEERHLLPTPELDRQEAYWSGGNYLNSVGLWGRFWQAREDIEQKRVQYWADIERDAERVAARAAGEELAPWDFSREKAGARLLIAGKITPEMFRDMVLGFDPELRPLVTNAVFMPEQSRPGEMVFTKAEAQEVPNSFEKRSADGEWVEFALDDGLDDLPDLWIGLASREFHGYPGTSIFLGFSSSDGWSYARRFARTYIAPQFPTLWFDWIGIGYNDQEVANRAERLQPLRLLDPGG